MKSHGVRLYANQETDGIFRRRDSNRRLDPDGRSGRRRVRKSTWPDFQKGKAAAQPKVL